MTKSLLDVIEDSSITRYLSRPHIYNDNFVLLQNKENSVTDSDSPKKKSTCTGQACRCLKRVGGVLDFSLFRSPMFRVLTLFFVTSPLINALPAFLPAMSKDKGLTESQAAILLSIIGGLDLCGRIITGFIDDLKIFKVSTLIAIAFVVLGAVCQLTRFLTTFPLMIGLAVVFGLLAGVAPCLVPILIMEDIGLEHTAKAMGFCKLFSGAAMAAGLPLLGYIRDVTVRGALSRSMKLGNEMVREIEGVKEKGGIKEVKRAETNGGIKVKEREVNGGINEMEGVKEKGKMNKKEGRKEGGMKQDGEKRKAGGEIPDPDDGVPYDRGWAWVVVLGAFINFVLAAGYNSGNYVFFVKFLEVFEASVSKTALLYGVKQAVNSVVGMFVLNAVVGRVGVRVTVLAGGFFLGVSAILASFATNLTYLIFKMTKSLLDVIEDSSITRYLSRPHIYSDNFVIPENEENSVTDSDSPKKKSLFRSPMFRVLTLFFVTAPLTNALPAFLPAMSKDKGLTESQAAVLLSSRRSEPIQLSFGELWGSAQKTYCELRESGLTWEEAKTCARDRLTRFLTTFPLMIGLAVVFGLLVGVTPCLVPILIMEDIGLEHTAKAMGFCKLFSGAAMAAGLPLLGACL
nr:hypothetical protein BaRGS_000474 [Batillaria attramentaria]